MWLNLPACAPQAPALRLARRLGTARPAGPPPHLARRPLDRARQLEGRSLLRALTTTSHRPREIDRDRAADAQLVPVTTAT
jgi:hypothetical protein